MTNIIAGFNPAPKTPTFTIDNPANEALISLPPGCPSCGNGQHFICSFQCIDCGKQSQFDGTYFIGTP